MLSELTQSYGTPDRFIPAISIAGSLASLANRLEFQLDEGLDDLDKFKFAFLQTGSGCVFSIMQYEGSDFIDVWLPANSSANDERCIKEIVRELRVRECDVFRKGIERSHWVA